MNILLTGANGYIGLRLLPHLLEAGHTIYALVRDRQRMPVEDFSAYGERLQILEADLAELPVDFSLPSEIDVAYFLVHSMGGGGDFSAREAITAEGFLKLLQPTKCAQIIYLGGIVPRSGNLSEHLESRRKVEKILGSGAIPLTTLRASIIVGSGSASFEIIRDLVEKLPVMITPRWTKNKCQPIAIRNVINYLQELAGKTEAYGRSFDIGGPEVLTYRALLEEYAQARQLKRWVIPVPLLRLKLSSYWLYFMTSTTFSLARALVESLAHDTICQNDDVRKLVPQELLTYREAIEMAFARIAQNRVPSSWFNALASGTMSSARLKSIHVPEHGVLCDRQLLPIQSSREEVINAVWSLGGAAGWPSMNWAWRVRGGLDRLVGGIGLRRGRRDPHTLHAGDAVDFWRVLMAARPHGRLILYAEMRLPGEGWLEFEITDKEIHQTATFRPLGLWGRLYWIFCLPFHWWLFPRMARRLAAPAPVAPTPA
ncbi:SDR family oxidoreductase [soil metagenome]